MDWTELKSAVRSPCAETFFLPTERARGQRVSAPYQWVYPAAPRPRLSPESIEQKAQRHTGFLPTAPGGAIVSLLAA